MRSWLTTLSWTLSCRAGSELGCWNRPKRIELFPDSGAILFESYRRALIKRFPYMAVYVVGDSRPVLLAVINVKRDPRWIQARLSERADD